MNRLIPAIVVIVLALSLEAYSQNLFPEKFSGCNTDQFALESDSATARMDHSELISVITSGFSEEVKNQLKGVVSLQIIVDLEGKSCLLSVKNDTNTKTKKLKLKDTIDSKLLWQKPTKKVAAVIVIKFDSTVIQLKRLGTNGKRGVHELKE